MVSLSCSILTSKVWSLQDFQADSNTKNYGSYDGFSYTNEAAVDNDSSIYGWAYAWTQNGSDAPVGYIGTEAQLFESNGTLCETTSYSYTPAAYYGWDNWTSGSCGKMYYYGRGWTRAYTGNGYYSIVTDISPNLYGS